ncbi:MAG: hypothetical protein JSW54_06515, partial [Fidelibacterota bacterium]
DNINGSEGNEIAFPFPDSEDIDGDSRISARNDYVTMSFDLDRLSQDCSPPVVSCTRRVDGSPTGWYLLSVPLNTFSDRGHGLPGWEEIKYLRFWITGLTEDYSRNGLGARIQIARVELVGNEWIELGIAPINSEEYTEYHAFPSVLKVYSTDENPDYLPPPGVMGEYDELTDSRLAEHSLVIDLRTLHLSLGMKMAIMKPSSDRTVPFHDFRAIQLYVFGEADDVLLNANSTYIWFWLRFQDESEADYAYYELRKPVYPGWDDRNHINAGIAEIEQLKLRPRPDSTVIVGNVTRQDTIRVFHLPDMAVLIKGDPSFESTGRYMVGIINSHPAESFKGQVMIDEFRLTQ